MSNIRAVVRGVGAFLPKRRVTNTDLAKQIDTSDEWIQQRTGIEARHIAVETETTSTLAVNAAKAALDNSDLNVEDIDLIIVATTTPDHTFPSVGVMVQRELGIKHGAAFDVQAVCTGFIYALSLANSLILTGQNQNILVIGAETMSRLLDWSDRTTCVLFGDGAGAVILSAQHDTDRGIISTKLRSDGSHQDKLYTDGGVSTTQTSGHLKMQGREVFRHAVGMITDVIEDVFMQANLTADDIDWFIPHQANKRIITASADKLNIPQDKTILTIQNHGNTSAASIPLAIATAAQENKLKTGDLILLEAMGGGFTWGAALLRW